MHHLEGRKEGEMGGVGGVRQHQPNTEEERRQGKKSNLDQLALELMARVGCCGNLTALRGQPSTINTITDIYNNT